MRSVHSPSRWFLSLLLAVATLGNVLAWQQHAPPLTHRSVADSSYPGGPHTLAR